ncbi:MAG: MoaD/ThiS family protein [Anaerolineae bacterium]|nr:MoaD/ThiS family protein [Anaerolineae bacterium]
MAETDSITIRVRLGAGLAPKAGNPRLTVTLDASATVADLVSYLREQEPTLAHKLNVAIPMVAGQHAAPSQLLQSGQEVALLMPVAGG